MPRSRDSCRIELRGWLDLDWAGYVGDMLVHEQVEQGAIHSTTLVGHPVDLEAFLGILHMLIDRGFSVEAFEYQHAPSSEAVPSAVTPPGPAPAPAAPDQPTESKPQ